MCALSRFSRVIAVFLRFFRKMYRRRWRNAKSRTIFSRWCPYIESSFSSVLDLNKTKKILPLKFQPVQNTNPAMFERLSSVFQMIGLLYNGLKSSIIQFQESSAGSICIRYSTMWAFLERFKSLEKLPSSGGTCYNLKFMIKIYVQR